MAIDPVKIPANVQIEDKIIGPVGLRQIFILMACSGISYAIWSLLKAAGFVSLWYLGLAWTPTVLGAAFAFVKINDVGLFTLMLLAIERMEKPTRRTFGPRSGITITITTGSKAEKDEEEATKKRKAAEAAKQEDRADVSTLSSILDRGLPVHSKEETEAPTLDDIQAANEAKSEEDEWIELENQAPVDPNRVRASSHNEAPPLDTLRPGNENDSLKHSVETIQPDESIFRDILPPRQA